MKYRQVNKGLLLLVDLYEAKGRDHGEEQARFIAWGGVFWKELIEHLHGTYVTPSWFVNLRRIDLWPGNQSLPEYFSPIGIYLASRFIFREPSFFLPFFLSVSNLTGFPSNYSCVPRGWKRSNNFWKSFHSRLPYGATLFKLKKKLP